jgi:putative membrane protein
LVVGQYEYVSAIPRRVAVGLFEAVGGDTAPLVEVLVPFATFSAGALVGLFSVAYGVRAAMRRYREATLAFLVSLMVGSLRLPVREVAAGVGDGPAAVLAVSAAALAGAAAVVVLDRYTDDLQF